MIPNIQLVSIREYVMLPQNHDVPFFEFVKSHNRSFIPSTYKYSVLAKPSSVEYAMVSRRSSM